MTARLAVVHVDSPLYRIARRPDPWAWPPWSYAGDDGTFGNRYDDPLGRYRVLYASGGRRGAYIETLARFRPDPAVVAALERIAGDESGPPAPELVPREWSSTRCLGVAAHRGAFCDIGHSDSLAHLRTALAHRLLHYGLEDLDAGDVRRRAPRALTQELSRYVFEHGSDEHGRPLAGIRYASRLGDDLENWAIFEGFDPTDQRVEEISADDPELRAALETLGLRLA
jgi:hypothetical protein